MYPIYWKAQSVQLVVSLVLVLLTPEFNEMCVKRKNKEFYKQHMNSSNCAVTFTVVYICNMLCIPQL